MDKKTRATGGSDSNSGYSSDSSEMAAPDESEASLPESLVAAVQFPDQVTPTSASASTTVASNLHGLPQPNNVLPGPSSMPLANPFAVAQPPSTDPTQNILAALSGGLAMPQAAANPLQQLMAQIGAFGGAGQQQQPINPMAPPGAGNMGMNLQQLQMLLSLGTQANNSIPGAPSSAPAAMNPALQHALSALLGGGYHHHQQQQNPQSVYQAPPTNNWAQQMLMPFLGQGNIPAPNQVSGASIAPMQMFQQGASQQPLAPPGSQNPAQQLQASLTNASWPAAALTGGNSQQQQQAQVMLLIPIQGQNMMAPVFLDAATAQSFASSIACQQLLGAGGGSLHATTGSATTSSQQQQGSPPQFLPPAAASQQASCLLYTSDAADE